jgi:transcription initiation factor TFIIIB Brf1 subunit/transcription initiation factor TFIIB
MRVSACRICGEQKPFGKKDRDRRNYWCKECGMMYEGMKMAKREKEWQEVNRIAIERLRLSELGSYTVSFK